MFVAQSLRHVTTKRILMKHGINLVRNLEYIWYFFIRAPHEAARCSYINIRNKQFYIPSKVDIPEIITK